MSPGGFSKRCFGMRVGDGFKTGTILSCGDRPRTKDAKSRLETDQVVWGPTVRWRRRLCWLSSSTIKGMLSRKFDLAVHHPIASAWAALTHIQSTAFTSTRPTALVPAHIRDSDESNQVSRSRPFVRGLTASVYSIDADKPLPADRIADSIRTKYQPGCTTANPRTAVRSSCEPGT